jgi:hypothetical protein
MDVHRRIIHVACHFETSYKKAVVNEKNARRLPDTEKFNVGQHVPIIWVVASVCASCPVFITFVIQRGKMFHCALSKVAFCL